jgi:hypothetical protein
MGSQEEIKIENDFILLRFQNESSTTLKIERAVSQGLIQFHFGIKGKGKFIFNQGYYALDLKEEKALLFYNPQKELPLHLELAPNTWVISVIICVLSSISSAYCLNRYISICSALKFNTFNLSIVFWL